MSIGKHWYKQKFLTIEQTAILITGGDPDCEKFITEHKRRISFIAADLTTAVRNDKEIIRKLIACGHNSIEDKFYDFQNTCSEYGVQFFESLKIDDFAVLDENIHPTIDSIKLSVKEIKSWLNCHGISARFFFPGSHDDELDPGVGLSEKELHPKERYSYLTIIAALCKELDINPEQRGIAVAIEKLIDSHGLKLTQDTIRTVFKQIPDALASRGKHEKTNS